LKMMDDKPLEDSGLIDGCLAGDDRAFEALVNKYQVPLLTMAWSLLGNKEDAQDAAQGAFMAAFSKLDTFDSSRSFKTWLFAIAWKDCLDMKRKEKTRRAFLEKAKNIAPPEGNPEPAASAIEESEIFRPLLKKLVPKERLALSLRINEGFTAAEIAEVLGCAESSARVYVFNAIRRIRKIWPRETSHV
jgi:RNA polymerase sigma-70 factor, ECF subfamily